MKIVDVQPSEILVEGNIRYGHNQADVDKIITSLESNGGVIHTPIKITKITGSENGHKYKLVFGENRLRAVTALNEKGAGLTIPAEVINLPDDKARYSLQVSENVDRSDMTPMDKAVAMKRGLDLGFTRQEVRAQFPTPKQQEKGAPKLEPCSNSHLNMHLALLELPKKIQDAVQLGKVTILGAWALVQEKRKGDDVRFNEILAELEEDRIKQIAKDEAEENRVLTAEAKEAKKNEALELVKAEAEKAAKALEEAEAALKAKHAEQVEALKASMNVTGEEKKAADERFKAAKVEAENAQKEKEKAAKAAKAAEEKKDKTVTKLTAPPVKSIRQEAINEVKVSKAIANVDAKKAGAPLPTQEFLKPTASQFITLGESITRSSSHSDVVKAVFSVLRAYFHGTVTPKNLPLAIGDKIEAAIQEAVAAKGKAKKK